MRLIITIFLMTCAAFAQDAPTKEQVEFQKKVAESKLALEPAKPPAAKELDNKNPKALKDNDSIRMTLLMLKAAVRKGQLDVVKVQAELAMRDPLAAANATAKEYNEALTELQKSHHAEGCQLIFDDSANVKEWDCPKK